MNIGVIFNKLLELPYSKKINDYQVSIRCPICGDSVKHENSAHCYVGLIDGTGPLVYHCWINECSGMVDYEFLKSCGIYDNNIAVEIKQFNKLSSVNKQGGYKFITPSMTKNIKVPHIKDTKDNRYRLEYMRKRIGIDFDYDDMEQLRVIFSLKDFVELNEIPVPEKCYKVAKYLNNQYIGFLSMSKEYIVFRNLKNDNKLRYFNYPIFGQLNNSHRFCTIPTTANLLSNDIQLHITEGYFDILSVYYNIRNCNNIDNIYTAVCGSGYLNTIKYFIRMGFVNNLNIHIYSDNDKPLRYYKNIINDLNMWYKDINIYYNDNEKDFGVPKNRISINKIKIL